MDKKGRIGKIQIIKKKSINEKNKLKASPEKKIFAELWLSGGAIER